MQPFITFIFVIGLLISQVGLLNGETQYQNVKALNGLKNPKIYFDVNVADDQKLLFRMNLLDRTVRQFKDADPDLSVVIGFRGGASRFITKGDHYVLEEELSNKKNIRDWVDRFAGDGISIEQCAIAAELLDIDYEDFLPGIEIVGNGYVSLVGYQNQGYAVVPMD